MNNKADITDRRAAKLLKRNEDYREITHYFGKSFKVHAKIQNRKNRRQVRTTLRDEL